MDTSIITYTPPESNVSIELQADYVTHTVWSTQKQIAQVLELDLSGVSRHIANFKKERGAAANRHIANIAITAEDGKTYTVEKYDMTVVAYVGFRAQATNRIIQFQEWVGEVLEKHVAPKQIDNLAALDYIVAEMHATRDRLTILESQNVELYAKQGEQAQNIEAINTRLNDADFYTILTWCRQQKINVALSVRQRWGNEAGDLSRTEGIEIKHVTEGRYLVGRYHKSILLRVCVVRPKTHGQNQLPGID